MGGELNLPVMNLTDEVINLEEGVELGQVTEVAIDHEGNLLSTQMRKREE